MRERSEFRDTLLEGFSRCVPSVLRELDRLSGEKSTPFKHKPVTKGLFEHKPVTKGLSGVYI